MFLKLADELGLLSRALRGVDHQLEIDAFTLLNNINMRFNNNSDVAYYKSYFIGWDDQTQEKWYDETYQLLLLYFLGNYIITKEKRKYKV